METEPESPQRNHLAYEPHQIQCPRCGTYNPKRRISYENPRTGEHKSAEGLHGCLIYMVAFFAIGIVVVLGVAGLLYLTGAINDPLNGDAGLISYPIAFAGAFAAIPLYRSYRRNRLSKTHITVGHFVCRQCEKEWTVIQEPPAKKLS